MTFVVTRFLRLLDVVRGHTPAQSRALSCLEWAIVTQTLLGYEGSSSGPYCSFILYFSLSKHLLLEPFCSSEVVNSFTNTHGAQLSSCYPTHPPLENIQQNGKSPKGVMCVFSVLEFYSAAFS